MNEGERERGEMECVCMRVYFGNGHFGINDTKMVVDMEAIDVFESATCFLHVYPTILKSNFHNYSIS